MFIFTASLNQWLYMHYVELPPFFTAAKRLAGGISLCLPCLCLLLLMLTTPQQAFAQKKQVYDYTTGEPVLQETDTIYPDEPRRSQPGERNFPFMVFEAGLNAGLSTGYELKEVFPFGNGVEFMLNFNPFYNNKLFVAPIMSFYYFTNYYDYATQDNLIWWGFGAQAKYYIKDRSKTRWNAYPAVSVKYNRVTNFLSPRPGYAGNTLDVLNGGGLSFSLGAGVTRNLTYLQVDYHAFNPMTKIDKDLQAQFNVNSGGLYEPYRFNKTRMGFGFLNFTLGIQLPVGRR
ncbi:hypothetical protein C7N43_28275 [Sphingobacteriales bacterium UPWRP_1]|nr:hypothetical protein C7N43_28275 [Sphingobacteriales bacterium UPWRP_1]